MNRKLLILVALLAVSGCESVSSPSDPPANSNIVLYTAIGASDTSGFGSSAPCLPLTSCPDGTGYVQTIERRLRTSGKSVTLLNLGIPGAVLAPEVQAIGNQLGRGIVGNFIEREIPFVQRNATLVSVFAGANDANTIGAAIAAGFGGVNPAGYVQTQTDNFGRDLRTLVAGIKDRAPQARIVFLNLPNMAGLPYMSGNSLTEKRWLQQIAVGFSAQINALGSQGALVIDLMCDPLFYQAGMYSSDGFHPNDAGYSRLADLIVAAENTGSVTPPRASCSQMAIF
jgi:lysophospholipase L1-like esterase